MKKLYKDLVLVLLFAVFIGCKDEDIDDIYPEIHLIQPLNCDSVVVGSPMVIKALFTDNMALGSYSVNIHHNFDHHNHSTEMNACILSPPKTPVNPFTYINSFEIEAGLKEKEVTLHIDLPLAVDTGDYHLMLRLTDREGWQSIKGLSVKFIAP